ncbi:hypothetical protein BX600DRAFT_315895 [Xylariales sp. PMI_506]|nr:hypothetical protein BX600DRAFT_315895 [Xylariales sp. PMI_506]
MSRALRIQPYTLLLQSSLHRHESLIRHASTDVRGYRPVTADPKTQSNQLSQQTSLRYSQFDNSNTYIRSAEGVPNAYVRGVARQHDFGFPNDLRPIRLKYKPNDTNVRVYVSRKHCFDVRNMQYLDKSLHPYAQSVLDRAVANINPLWWKAHCFGDAKVIIIRTAERRLRRGIRIALVEAGYDSSGKRLSLPTVSGASRVLRRGDLCGTIHVTCAQPLQLCKQKFSQVLELCKAVIAEAEAELQGKVERGQTLQSAKAPRQRNSNDKFSREGKRDVSKRTKG